MWRAVDRRRRRGDRAGAARRGRLQPRRGRGRPGGDRRRAAASGSAPAPAAGSGSSRRAPRITAICGAARSPARSSTSGSTRPTGPITARSTDQLALLRRPLRLRAAARLPFDAAAARGHPADRVRRPPRPQRRRLGQREALAIARRAGFEAGLNDPFAGGHVVERHGGPARGVHALQIEIDRRCYLDATLKRPGPGSTGSRADRSARGRAWRAAARPAVRDRGRISAQTVARRRLRDRRGGLALLHLAREHVAHLRQREQMARRSAAACRSGSSSAARRREARAASLRRPSGTRDRRTAAHSLRAGSRPRRPSAGRTSSVLP